MWLSPAQEQDLVERARRGDEQAFEQIIQVFSTPLYRVVRRLASDEQEAEAVIQEAFWRTWRSLPHYHSDRPFFPYLVTVALNLQRDRWRSERRVEPADLENAAARIADEMPAPERQLEDAEELEQLSAAIERLPGPYRAVIALRYEGNLSYEEIATALALPLNTVRTHLFRAREMLRKMMEDYNG